MGVFSRIVAVSSSTLTCVRTTDEPIAANGVCDLKQSTELGTRKADAMATLYPSHNGKSIPVGSMARPHIESALAKLKAQKANLSRMAAGLEEDARKVFKVAMSPWFPAFTLEEMLDRTNHWIKILEEEIEKRKNNSWQGLM